MAKIKIKKSDLDRIIKEETTKFKKAIILKKELASIKKQLNQLNEVEAGGSEEPTGGSNLTPAETQFVKDKFQHKPKFHNPSKNPNTMMEDDEEIEDTEIEDTDMNLDTDVDDDGKIDKAAVLSAIEDLKMALNLSGDAGDEGLEDAGSVEDLGSEEGVEEPEEGEIEGSEEAEVTDKESDEENTEDNEEGDESFEFEEEGVQENLEEPIVGKTPVQNAQQDNVNDNMEKTNDPKAGGTLMESEKKRMAVLAGIIKG